jgi:predicted metal-dependent phosphotriesterase family hydrolase
MFLFNGFLPRLVKAGLAEADAMALVTDNPRRALTGED